MQKVDYYKFIIVTFNAKPESNNIPYESWTQVMWHANQIRNLLGTWCFSEEALLKRSTRYGHDMTSDAERDLKVNLHTSTCPCTQFLVKQQAVLFQLSTVCEAVKKIQFPLVSTKMIWNLNYISDGDSLLG